MPAHKDRVNTETLFIRVPAGTGARLERIAREERFATRSSVARRMVLRALGAHERARDAQRIAKEA